MPPTAPIPVAPEGWRPEPNGHGPHGGDRLRSLLRRGDWGFGLWLLPMFVMAAMLGATAAFAFVVLYYGQQVNDLESVTRGARAEVIEAREEVRQASEDAQATIQELIENRRRAGSDGQ